MNDTIEHINSRLDNIHSVEPILGAQRTIAMGNWKVALNRLSWAQDYAARLDQIAAMVSYRLLTRHKSFAFSSNRSLKRIGIVAIGSERGLCGAFNRILAEYVQNYLNKFKQDETPVSLHVIGERTTRIFQRQGIQPDQVTSGSSTTLPTPSFASMLASQWLAAYESHEIDQINLVFNAYRGAARYEPQSIQLIPPRIAFNPMIIPETWLEIIIETNADALLSQTLVQQLETRTYACLIESSAAENSARFQLLEDARQNIERLTTDLEETAAHARRQAITREIQNLAIGAGLLQQDEINR
jgi:F-type H+-transporting ATPase subunit gamma